MALINRKSDLTTLKFGRDRKGGGSSGQPYVTTPIPDRDKSIDLANSFLGNDFINRGGVVSLSSTLRDQERLLKFFSGAGKSVDGLLFTAKQNTLARHSPITGAELDRTYNPLNTLAQAGVVSKGQHYIKDGKDLIIDDNKTYYQKTKNPEIYNTSALGPNNRNKLLLLYETKIISPFSSTLSVDGAAEAEARNFNNFNILGRNSLLEASSNTQNAENNLKILRGNLGKFGISEERNVLFSYQGGPNSTIGGKTIIRRNIEYDTTKAFSDNQSNNTTTGKILAFTPDQLIKANRIGAKSTTGFSRKIKDEEGNSYNGVGNFQQSFKNSTAKQSRMSEPVDYNDFNRADKYGEGNPGQAGIRKRSTYYTTNVKEIGEGKAKNIYEYDKINATKLYSSTAVESPSDIIKFHIGAINLDSPTELTWIHFKAYNLNFNDQYIADWQSYKYMGRGNPFYKYNGYSRSITMGFDVALQSRYEQPIMYSKLNYLASLTAPNYSKIGFMRGNILKITVGDYLNQVYGVLTGLTYGIPDDTPWDIAKTNTGSPDPNSSELPLKINVSSFTFLPIHNFYDSSVEKIKGIPEQRFISMGDNGNGYPSNEPTLN